MVLALETEKIYYSCILYIQQWLMELTEKLETWMKKSDVSSIFTSPTRQFACQIQSNLIVSAKNL